MDINTARSVLTVVFFVLFVGIVWWAYRRGGRKDFEEAQRLPFADTEMPGSVDLRGEKR